MHDRIEPQYFVSQHSRIGVRWFSMSELLRQDYWSSQINSETIGFTALSDAKNVARALQQRPENQGWNTTIRVAKWEGDYFNFWEVA